MDDNFYQILQIPVSATPLEIESVISNCYNQARRLVTHHDPKVVNQANHALMVIEQARTILLDAQKRAAYDAALGLTGQTGGLADPQVILNPFNQHHILTPPSPRLGQSSADSESGKLERTDAWVCSTCQTANPISSQFCKTCGNLIGIVCPNCQKIIESRATFCQSCGVNVRETITRKQEEEQKRQLREKAESERIRNAHIQQLAVYSIASAVDKNLKLGLWGLLFFILGQYWISIPLQIIMIYKISKILSSAQIPGDTQYRNKAKNIFWLAIIPLILAIIIIVIIVVGWIVGSISSM